MPLRSGLARRALTEMSLALRVLRHHAFDDRICRVLAGSWSRSCTSRATGRLPTSSRDLSLEWLSPEERSHFDGLTIVTFWVNDASFVHLVLKIA